MKSNLAKKEVRCPSCAESRARLVATGFDREYDDTTDDRFTMVKCEACRLLYLSPRPDESELPTIYPDNYHAYDMVRGKKRGVATVTRQWVYGLRLRKALRSLAADRPLSLLDIGCGDAWMLDCYRALRPDARTFGVDINARACAIARHKGHEVFEGRFEDIDFANRRFDFINASHVIEHVADPKAFLRKAASLLAPGGALCIETPNTQSLDARLFGESWGAFHFPRHWTLYDAHTLSEMARSCGLRPDKIYFHACPVHWHWSLHNLFTGKAWLKPLAKIFRPDIIFRKGLLTICYLAFFTVIDQAIKLSGLPTSNMMAILRPGRECDAV